MAEEWLFLVAGTRLAALARVNCDHYFVMVLSAWGLLMNEVPLASRMDDDLVERLQTRIWILEADITGLKAHIELADGLSYYADRVKEVWRNGNIMSIVAAISDLEQVNGYYRGAKGEK